MKTHKETYDEVLAHMRRQGKPSFVMSEDGNKQCLYRMPDGRRCAAGCLSEEYFEEGRSANSLGNAAVLRRAGHDPEFVRLLQIAHDAAAEYTYTFLQQFEERAETALYAVQQESLAKQTIHNNT